MGITAITGPHVVNGDSSTESNEQSPSLFAWGEGFVDKRPEFSYTGATASYPKVRGFPQNGLIQTLNAYIYGCGNLVNSQSAIAGTSLTFLTTARPGITPGITVREMSTNTLVRNVVAFDDFNTTDYNGVPVATCERIQGPAGAVACWDPSVLSSRRISFTGAVGPNTFSILGIDVYGFYVSETLDVPDGFSTTLSAKTYKYIVSIIPVNFNGAWEVATTPQIGVPLRFDNGGEAIASEDGIGVDIDSSLSFITDIVPDAGELTITLFQPTGLGRDYVLPVGAQITISRCNPVVYDGTYTITASSPGSITVSSVVDDEYVSGGNIFCDRSGPLSIDVRGVCNTTNLQGFNLLVFQSISFDNMTSSVGQFGVPQYYSQE